MLQHIERIEHRIYHHATSSPELSLRTTTGAGATSGHREIHQTDHHHGIVGHDHHHHHGGHHQHTVSRPPLAASSPLDQLLCVTPLSSTLSSSSVVGRRWWLRGRGGGRKDSHDQQSQAGDISLFPVPDEKPTPTQTDPHSQEENESAVRGCYTPSTDDARNSNSSSRGNNNNNSRTTDGMYQKNYLQHNIRSYYAQESRHYADRGRLVTAMIPRGACPRGDYGRMAPGRLLFLGRGMGHQREHELSDGVVGSGSIDRGSRSRSGSRGICSSTGDDSSNSNSIFSSRIHSPPSRTMSSNSSSSSSGDSGDKERIASLPLSNAPFSVSRDDVAARRNVEMDGGALTHAAEYLPLPPPQCRKVSYSSARLLHSTTATPTPSSCSTTQRGKKAIHHHSRGGPRKKRDKTRHQSVLLPMFSPTSSFSTRLPAALSLSPDDKPVAGTIKAVDPSCLTTRSEGPTASRSDPRPSVVPPLPPRSTFYFPPPWTTTTQKGRRSAPTSSRSSRDDHCSGRRIAHNFVDSAEPSPTPPSLSTGGSSGSKALLASTPDGKIDKAINDGIKVSNNKNPKTDGNSDTFATTIETEPPVVSVAAKVSGSGEGVRAALSDKKPTSIPPTTASENPIIASSSTHNNNTNMIKISALEMSGGYPLTHMQLASRRRIAVHHRVLQHQHQHQEVRGGSLQGSPSK